MEYLKRFEEDTITEDSTTRIFIHSPLSPRRTGQIYSFCRVQVQVRKVPTAMARQTSEDDEISRIKKQNKSAAAPATETVEERQPATTPAPAHPPPREAPAEREPEEPTRRPMPARYALTITIC